MATNWTDDETAALNSVWNAKSRNDQGPVAPPPSPHGTLPSGAADFRKFPLTRMSGVAISNADFTGSRSPNNQYGVDQLIMLTWVHCDHVVFDKSRVFHRIDGQFRSCSFRKIGAAGCNFDGTFTDCDFSGTSFRNAGLAANFVRCKFHDCNMKVAGWGSSFEDCEFQGATIDPIFEDVRDAALSADRVTFCVLTHKVHVGETRHIS